MFKLSLIEHDLPMPPHLMSRPIVDAVKSELQRLFLDKVSFFLLMFKPFDGEVLVGRISGYDDNGLQEKPMYESNGRTSSLKDIVKLTRDENKTIHLGTYITDFSVQLQESLVHHRNCDQVI